MLESPPDWLLQMDASLKSRNAGGDRIIADPSLITPLAEIAFGTDLQLTKKALWSIENAVIKDPSIAVPILPQISEYTGKVRNSSSIRSMAKICEVFFIWADQQDHLSYISKDILEGIIDICFQWLTGPHKVAAKAHSMTALYHLGSYHPWVREELRQILRKDYHRSKPGYQARARITLKELDKNS